MSKMFFKGRIDARLNHVKAGYNTNRDIKLGSEESPLNLIVQTAERQTEIEAILAETKLVANIEVNADKEENIRDLDGMLNKPKTTVFEKKPNRNDLCSCGSGKKYKKCCA
ncbi:PBPRA1643 family SWIM/SEC-C metal-binding motif protein [Moritella sp. F3]|uniref:PBPRA1643 family SWIM/SEC-C metal-binding motif protein n=1 Tax=Moritella sp. F3 TaxID=2718882 RepID=UPI0018E17329|nr:PBPRA1643 family SWIM/SEC-C metal-binding motif protein [Moritella sp. F3]GIC79224.1 zinc chelation protein SecC [Moritella sp. F1]GIC81088.1 zinc chelation protein SecC [Moritella sp. F3]